MKKLFAVFLLAIIFGFVGNAYAINTFYTNSRVMAWDAVTTMEDGSEIPAEAKISYVLYVAEKNKDPEKSNPIKMGETADHDFAFTFVEEGAWVEGVQAIRKDDAGNIMSKSAIAWSDNPEVVNEGKTFLIQYYKAPATPFWR